MEGSLTEEERIRLKVKKRLDARNEFYVHVITFVMVNLLLWVIWYMTTPGGFMWPLIAMGGWGIGLAAHLFDYYTKYGGGRDRMDAMMEREIERERRRIYGDGYGRKAKNEDLYYDEDDDCGVRLTGDGEFTESFVEEQEQRQHRQNR